MKACKEGVIRKTRMHAINGAYNKITSRTNSTGIIHFINSNRSGRFADNPGNLAMSKKIAGSP